jgi:hypothetical protein
MTVQHNAITDPDLHEPKGIAAATAGKVYVSDGASSGEWKYAPGKAHAELYITSGATTHTLAAASAYSLLNPSGEWTASGNEDHLTVDAANGEIDLLYAGHYFISFWMTFSTASIASGSQYKFKFAVDGVTSPRTVYVTKPTNGVDIIEISATGLVSATANQTLTIQAAGDGTSSGTTFTPLETGLQALFLD